MGLLSCSVGSSNIPMRFIVTLFCFGAMCLSYAQRVVLNLCIVEMVEKKVTEETKLACPLSGDLANASHTVIQNIQGGKMDWSEPEQSYVLEGFFIGYLIFHIPLGFWVDRSGARIPFFFGFALSTVSTGLIPVCAIYLKSYILIMILRVITGTGQAVLFPAISRFIAFWIPPDEKATISGLIFAGTCIGSVLGNLLSGAILAGMESWTLPFYFWLGLSLLYMVLYLMYVYPEPNLHPHITDDEKSYLAEMIIHSEKMKTPFGKILGDIAVWSHIIANLSHTYLMFTLITYLPKYLNQVLNFTMKDNKYLCSMPYFFMLLLSLVGGIIADRLISKHNANVLLIRVLYTCLANFGSGAFILLGGLSDCNRILALIFFYLAVMFQGFFFCGTRVNLLDLSSRHSGFVSSLVNSLGGLSGMAATHVVGNVVQDNTLFQWHIVYLIVCAVCAAACFFYIPMARGHRRPWDYLPNEDQTFDRGEGRKWYQERSTAAFLVWRDKTIEEKQLLKERKRLRKVASKEAHKKMKANRKAQRENQK